MSTDKPYGYLTQENRRFITYIAKRLTRDPGELEELEAQGLLLSLQAEKQFDPSHGIKFVSFMGKFLQYKLRRHLQRLRSQVTCTLRGHRAGHEVRCYSLDYVDTLDDFEGDRSKAWVGLVRDQAEEVHNEETPDLDAFIASLEPDLREVLRRRYEGATPRAISADLGISTREVVRTLRRCYARYLGQLSPSDPMREVKIRTTAMAIEVLFESESDDEK